MQISFMYFYETHYYYLIGIITNFNFCKTIKCKLFQSGHLNDSPIKNESQKNSSDIGIEVYNWCRAGCKRHFNSEESDHHHQQQHSNNVCTNDIGATADSTEKANSFKQMRLCNDNVLIGNGVMDINDNFVVVASTNNNNNNNNSNNNNNESL